VDTIQSESFVLTNLAPSQAIYFQKQTKGPSNLSPSHASILSDPWEKEAMPLIYFSCFGREEHGQVSALADKLFLFILHLLIPCWTFILVFSRPRHIVFATPSYPGTLHVSFYFRVWSAPSLFQHEPSLGYTVRHNRRLSIHVFRRPIGSGVVLHLLTTYTLGKDQL
jgi:hypothetical protein